MPRKCSSSLICFSKITCLLILFLVGIIIYILLKKSLHTLVRHVPRDASPNHLSYHYDIRTNYENPHIPPLRDNKFYAQHIGIPIKFKNEPGELKFLFAERGEHTKEILTELGYDDNLVCSLKESGVF